MPRPRRSLLALPLSAALMLSACGGPLKQADDPAPVPKAPQIGVQPLPYPEPTPYFPPEDELPGGYGWPTWGDCSDSLAC